MARRSERMESQIETSAGGEGNEAEEKGVGDKIDVAIHHQLLV